MEDSGTPTDQKDFKIESRMQDIKNKSRKISRKGGGGEEKWRGTWSDLGL